jgi:hypothetical protein
VKGNARLLYALCPIAILVSAWHGQIEPIAIALGLSALLLAKHHRDTCAGIVLGLAIASKTWPVLFVPGVLREVKQSRWWRVLIAAGAVLLGLFASVQFVLHDSLSHAAHTMISYRSFVGSWGWTGVLHYADVAGVGYAGPRVDQFQRLGTLVMTLTLVSIVFLFRRCSGPDLTVALLLGFLTVTAGFGPQYLLWPAALLCASRRPAGQVYLLLASVYAGFFYLYAFPLNETIRSWPATFLELGSIPVILTAVAAMPWKELRHVKVLPNRSVHHHAADVDRLANASGT